MKGLHDLDLGAEQPQRLRVNVGVGVRDLDVWCTLRMQVSATRMRRSSWLIEVADAREQRKVVDDGGRRTPAQLRAELSAPTPSAPGIILQSGERDLHLLERASD